MPANASESRQAASKVVAYVAATVVALGLAWGPVYVDGTPEAIKHLLVPIAMIASGVLLFFVTPIHVGRLLSLAPWSSPALRVAAYIVWAVSLTPLGADFYVSGVWRVVVELPVYINSHGFSVAIVGMVGVVSYPIFRRLPLRGCDVFPLLPTLSGFIALVISEDLKREREIYPNLPLYILLVLVLSISSRLAFGAKSNVRE